MSKLVQSRNQINSESKAAEQQDITLLPVALLPSFLADLAQG